MVRASHLTENRKIASIGVRSFVATVALNCSSSVDHREGSPSLFLSLSTMHIKILQLRSPSIFTSWPLRSRHPTSSLFYGIQHFASELKGLPLPGRRAIVSCVLYFRMVAHTACFGTQNPSAATYPLLKVELNNSLLAVRRQSHLEIEHQTNRTHTL